MADTSMLHVRVDSAVKAEAARVLGSFGMTTSEAVRFFLHRVVSTRSFPLELKEPNDQTLSAMAEAEGIVRDRRARFETADELFNDLEKSRR